MSKQLNIGVVTKYSGNFYHGALVHAINKSLIKLGAKMFVINTFMVYRFLQNQENDSFYSKLALNHIDGWLILSEGASIRFAEMLCKTGKPVITVGCKFEGVNCTSILEDSRHCAESVVQHLLDHGHKKIVYIGCNDVHDMRERFEGYKTALCKNSVPYDPDLCVMADLSDVNLNPLGKSAIKQLLGEKRQFTAVFAANDLIALGAIDTLKEAGIRVPEDVAVIGYDDTIYAKSDNLSLSSVRQDLNGIGTAAAEAIIRSLKEKSISCETILVSSNIIRRNSCGCKESSNNEDEIYTSDARFKNTVINYLQKEIGKSYGTASDLLITNISEIKKVIPKIANNYSIQCIGFWNEKKELYVDEIIDEKNKSVLNLDRPCPIENFPPEEFMKYVLDADIEDIVWLIPVSTTSRDWCIIAYIGPYNKANLILMYDSSVVLFNLIGILLDHDVANQKLKNTLETLQQTQEQLIQSEKMVSLGSLVAGVAHEINTPIGVSVTAASYIKDSSYKFMKLTESGKLTRSQLEKFVATNTETADILLLNLSKASYLVNSFKQVAVDQSCEEKRSFNVKDYVNEVLLSLTPNLKKTKIAIDIDCPDDLEIYNYPGGLSQILTNLVVNSVMHAFDEDKKGIISIRIYKFENVMNFIYSDNGHGIEKDNISKIFDPFYTTKRGSGGTGLGLNIVYNIVTQQYGGSIRCESVSGIGTTFTIKIPL
ncbi:MAG TPA: substrate-binding domain-containing protein [Pseudobacteroides sp.]|uniref:substrate-binding domain-containing protein n=1 Tax=Pseudobacteroides sp. TaxID=1968840 RepID=UPI002F93E3ED